MSSFGVDVSMHQCRRDAQGNYHNVIDWRAARDESGVRWAYVKVTEGIGYVDPGADSQINAIRATGGILPGGYTFCRPDTNPPEADAEHFGAQLLARGLVGENSLPPCLDMEQEAGVPRGFDMLGWTRRCVDRLRAVTGYPLVMIYANRNWWINLLGSGEWLDDNAFAWVAEYGVPAGSPGWKGRRAVAHQYASDGRIAGYGGNIDVNVCWVDLGSLATGGVPLPAPGGGGGGVFRPGGFPIPRDEWFGDIDGPRESHGGASPERGGIPGEATWVLEIQRQLIRKGYARRRNGQVVTNPMDGWADGVWGQVTTDALIRWQRDHMPHTTYWGQLWWDDWDKLFS